MLDTYINQTKRVTEHVNQVIHEHKAPTDDSIRLYDEIKEKAYNSILKSVKIENNVLNIKAIIYKDMLTFNTKVKYSLTINGTEYLGEFIADEFEYATKDNFYLLKALYTNASNHISMALIQSFERQIIEGKP